MLPNQIIQIGDGLIHHYDRENPSAKKFPEIRNSVLSSWSARGFSGWQSGAVTEIGEQLRFFLEKKGRYIVVILRDILSSATIEFYDDINADMKAYLATHFNPAVTAAKNYLEEIRVEANAPG